MLRRTGARRNKRQHSTRKKPSQKKKLYVGVVILGSVFAGIFGYALYRYFTSRETLPFLLPPFEAYAPQGIEAKIQEIDRSVYDALLELSIHPEDVTFKTAQPKTAGNSLWCTFSELEIRLPASHSEIDIKNVFLGRLSPHIPEKSLWFVSGASQQPILNVSINGHHTHRLSFLEPGRNTPAPSPSSPLPKVAIIIDDLGYDQHTASKFLSLNGVKAFSVLPHSPFQKSIANALLRSDRDILLHLPMEPLQYPQVNPGVGALLCSMSPDDLLDQLRKDLNAVPFIVGVNNHMGSKLTQDPAIMHEILAVLKKRNLFFVDSVTNSHSCSQQAARVLNLRFAQRQVFLDHDQDPNAIRFQIRRLISMAKERGKAIGIGHPYPTTWKVLSDELPNIGSEVELVRVSELVGQS